MVRVLHIIAHLEKGGAEKQLQLLIGASRHQHIVLVPRVNVQDVSFPVLCFETLSFGHVFARVREVIREEGIDIVQLWLPERLTFPAMLAARLEGVQVISGDRRKPRARGWGAIRDRLQYVVHLGAHKVVPNYPVLPKPISLRGLLGLRRKTTTISNGLATEQRRVRFEGRAERLLTVGRLAPQKRVELLIHALEVAFPDVALDIVGEGPSEGELKLHAETSVAKERVAFHGRRSDWGDAFSTEASVLVLPSESEGMSNVVFEAIAFGFVVVTRASSEFCEITKGWSVKPILFGDGAQTLEDALATAMALDPEARTELVRALQAEVAKYSVGAMAAQYDAMYSQLGRRASHGLEAT